MTVSIIVSERRNTVLTYLRLEVLRVIRNSRYLFLSLATPVGFYLLFSSLFGSQPAEGLKQSVELMVSMAAYGAIGAVLFATGPRVAAERGTGWLRQLRTTPLSAGKVIAARVLAAMTLGFPAVVLVSITAALAHGVRLTAGEWAAPGMQTRCAPSRLAIRSWTSGGQASSFSP